MARVTIEDCLDNVENRFALVMLAAKRARALEGGRQGRVRPRRRRPALGLEHRAQVSWLGASLREARCGWRDV